MRPISETVKNLLETAGLGTFAATSGWGIFINEWPSEDPNTAILIKDSGGFDPQGYADPDVRPLRRPTFQILVRAQSYDAAWDRLQEVQRAVSPKSPFNVAAAESGANAVRVHVILTTTDPLPLPRDERNRYVWSLNFRSAREQRA